MNEINEQQRAQKLNKLKSALQKKFLKFDYSAKEIRTVNREPDSAGNGKLD